MLVYWYVYEYRSILVVYAYTRHTGIGLLVWTTEYWFTGALVYWNSAILVG